MKDGVCQRPAPAEHVVAVEVTTAHDGGCWVVAAHKDEPSFVDGEWDDAARLPRTEIKFIDGVPVAWRRDGEWVEVAPEAGSVHKELLREQRDKAEDAREAMRGERDAALRAIASGDAALVAARAEVERVTADRDDLFHQLERMTDAYDKRHDSHVEQMSEVQDELAAANAESDTLRGELAAERMAGKRLKEVVNELLTAMRRYEMDVDTEAPLAHQDMIRRAEHALCQLDGKRCAMCDSPIPDNQVACKDCYEYAVDFVRVPKSDVAEAGEEVELVDGPQAFANWRAAVKANKILEQQLATAREEMRLLEAVVSAARTIRLCFCEDEERIIPNIKVDEFDDAMADWEAMRKKRIEAVADAEGGGE